MARIRKLAFLLLGAQAAWAQYVVSAHAGTIHFTRGQVFVDDKPFARTSLQFPLLREGQILRTGNGRAEVLLGSGVFLRLGELGAIRMLDTRLEDTQVELLEGTALIEVVDMPRGSDVHVVVGSTHTGFRGIGLHRFDAGSGELRVFGGHADVFAPGQALEASRGRVVHLGDTLTLSKFDPRQKDALHQWSARRSFLLFTSSPESMARQTNWEVRGVAPPQIAGFMDRGFTLVANRDFDVMFRSRFIARAPFPGDTPPPISAAANSLPSAAGGSQTTPSRIMQPTPSN